MERDNDELNRYIRLSGCDDSSALGLAVFLWFGYPNTVSHGTEQSRFSSVQPARSICRSLMLVALDDIDMYGG